MNAADAISKKYHQSEGQYDQSATELKSKGDDWAVLAHTAAADDRNDGAKAPSSY